MSDTLTAGKAWSLKSKVTRAGLDLARVTTWTSRAFGKADLAHLTREQGQLVEQQIPRWKAAVELEIEAAREAAKERKAIQDADERPIDLTGWVEDYARGEAQGK